MKKYFTLFALTVFLMGAVTKIDAQNRYVFNTGDGASATISYSDNMMVQFQHDNYVSLVNKAAVKPQQRGNAPAYTLKVYFPGESDCHLYVSDGVDKLAEMYSFEGDHLEIELEEGTYYLLATGTDSATDKYCIWVKDDVELAADTDLQIDFSQCEYGFNVDLVDENGTKFNDLEINSAFYVIPFFWLDGLVLDELWINSDHVSDDHMLNYWCSGFDEKSSFLLNLTVEQGNQKSYYFSFPKVYGMSGNLTFDNSPEDLVCVEERFNFPEVEEPWYYVFAHQYYVKLLHGYMSTFLEMASSDFVFDPTEPYTIISNLKIDEDDAFETGAAILSPTVYGSVDWEQGMEGYRNCIRTPYYINADGNVVREALPRFQNGFEMVSTPNWFPATPAMSLEPSAKMTYYGERTPLSFFSPVAFNSDNFPLGMTLFMGSFLSSGECSSERKCDDDQVVTVSINGEEAFADSILVFNGDANLFMLDDPAPVVVKVDNRHLFANGVSKSNQTRVDFDLQNDDAMPPTMTFLRVLNGEGGEAIQLTNLSQSSVVFGCADYTSTFDMDWGVFMTSYYSRPTVELLYSTDGAEWVPLNVVEDESLFHENHGNVFVADLSQLDGQVADQWVSLKFVLTDEAGNSQMQTLENLFYAGVFESVSEVGGLAHSIYPNPFQVEVRIKVGQPLDGQADIKVYNVLGSVVYSREERCQGSDEILIDGSVLKPGIYFYDIRLGDTLLQGRMVKE